MGSDNGETSIWNRNVTFNAARFGLMTTLLVVFLVFVSMGGNESKSPITTHEIRSGQSRTKTIHDGRSANYDNFMWRELPPPVRRAALKLGYTPRSWDNSVNFEPPVFNKPWNKLMPDEKRAAAALGYIKNLGTRRRNRRTQDQKKILVNPRALQQAKNRVKRLVSQQKKARVIQPKQKRAKDQAENRVKRRVSQPKKARAKKLSKLSGSKHGKKVIIPKIQPQLCSSNSVICPSLL
jgi:hypothetical protein